MQPTTTSKKLKEFISFSLSILLITPNLYADKNWIDIQPINQPKSKETKKNIDINLTQIKPINTMMQRATIIKDIIKIVDKKKELPKDEKNWFLISH